MSQRTSASSMFLTLARRSETVFDNKQYDKVIRLAPHEVFMPLPLGRMESSKWLMMISTRFYLRQGHNHQTIESYKKGLQNCAIQGSLMANLRREQLIHLEVKGKEKQRRRIDLIRRLPLEILSDIFSAFSSENLAAFTLVSPA